MTQPTPVGEPDTSLADSLVAGDLVDAHLIVVVRKDPEGGGWIDAVHTLLDADNVIHHLQEVIEAVRGQSEQNPL